MSLASFFAEFAGVKKTGFNTFTKAHYPTLDDVVNGTTWLLLKHGLYITHTAVCEPLTQPAGRPALLSRLHDADTDEVLACSRLLLPATDDPQKIGAAITYYKRYNICALLNIAEPDDDGESAKPVQDAPRATSRPATEAQLAAIKEYADADQIPAVTLAWLEKTRAEQGKLTEAQATALLVKLGAQP